MYSGCTHARWVGSGFLEVGEEGEGGGGWRDREGGEKFYPRVSPQCLAVDVKNDVDAIPVVRKVLVQQALQLTHQARHEPCHCRLHPPTRSHAPTRNSPPLDTSIIL